MESRLALESVISRPITLVPKEYLSPIGTYEVRKVRSDYANAVSTAYAVPVDDLQLGMTAFNTQGLPPREDRGSIPTNIDATDSWKINTTLSWIPSHLRTIDKTLGVSSHFPRDGSMEISLTSSVSSNRFEAASLAVDRAIREGTYLLLDCRLPRASDDGHVMPKSWLWDVYDEVGRRLDPNCNTDDSETINQDTCITVADGRIMYSRNRKGYFLSIDGEPYSDDDFILSSTFVTDSYMKRVREILQEAYNEGLVHFYDSPPNSFSRVTERLWKPIHPTYPSAVEVYYN